MFEQLKEKFVACKTQALVGAGTALTVGGIAVPAFAAEGDVVAPVVTSAMLAPITETLNTNLGVLLPVGIGIMAVMIGIGLIPRILYKFL